MEETQNQPIQPSTPPPAQPPLRNKLGGTSRKRYALFGVLALLAVAIPASIFLNQQSTDNRQRAAGGACGLKPVDVILVIDTSNSMAGGNLSQAKQGATTFVEKLLSNGTTNNRVGIATFDNNGGLNIAPTNQKATLLSVINGLTTPGNGKGGTCLECALDKDKGSDVRSGFASMAPRPNDRHIVILTDGKINHYQKPDGTIAGSTQASDEQKARDQATSALNRIVAENAGIGVSVMQYGGTSNQSWLTGSIVKAPGTYINAQQSGVSIASMFESIAKKLVGGTIVAFVFNDTNKNGTADTDEKGLPEVVVTLNDGTNDTPGKTDGNGEATFTGVCSFTSYKLTVTPLTNYEGSPDQASLVKSNITVSENQTVRYPFGLKKMVNATSLVCDPTDIAVNTNGDVQTVKATLKDKDGNTLANKAIIWNTDTNNITIISPIPQPTPTSAPAVTASPQVNSAKEGSLQASTNNTTEDSFFDRASSLIVPKVYAACSGNRDCRNSEPYCIGGSCKECRNPGSTNDCGGGKVCNSNHKCVAPTPTVTPLPTATSIPTPTTAATATPAITVTVPPTTTPVVTTTPGDVLITTDANGVATVTFKKSASAAEGFTAKLTARFAAEGIYTDASCVAMAKYEPPAPELTLVAEPETVKSGETTKLTWTTKNVTECTASEGWSGTKAPTGGSETSAPLTEQKTFALTCKGPGGEITKNVTVDIETVGPTPPAGSTTLNLNAFLHGIGAAGDNVVLRPAPCQAGFNTGATTSSASATECFSNRNPKHPTRFVKVEIFNQNNESIKVASGSVTYDNTSGTFKGSVNLGESWTTGTYTVKVWSPTYLRRQLPGTRTITANTVNNLDDVDLVSSDVDNDNKLSILDYNLIIACYTRPGQTVPTCSNSSEASDPTNFLTDGVYTPINAGTLKTRAWRVDVDDNGVNNEFDENLFRRDLIVQYGQ